MLAGVYVHIPFCQVRCGYCDFNAYAGLDRLIQPYADALRREAGQVADGAGRAGLGRVSVPTVYFGGGTPTLLPTHLLEQCLHGLRSGLTVLPDAEVTIEANPGTVDARRLAALRAMGFNRLSLGVQSAHVEDLEVLERRHAFDEAVRHRDAYRKSGGR